MSSIFDDVSEEFLNSDTVNDEFFNDIVEQKLRLNRKLFKLRMILFGPATGVNDNYTSVLYRVKIKIERIATNTKENVDVIIKALLLTRPEVKEFTVFARERFIYEDVIKSFEEIWLSKTKKIINFAPFCYKIISDPYEVIILDDMKSRGYVMMDRKVGLNLEYAHVVLSKLAFFHATSTIRYQKDGVLDKIIDRKAKPFPKRSESPMFGSFCRMHKSFLEAIRSFGSYDEYAEKIARWDCNKLWSCFVRISEPMKSGFKVLNHADMWMNNFMFKIDAEGKPIDAILIDFQGCYWGSPSGDLIYFLITSINNELKINNFDKLVDFYHKMLVIALKKLNFDEPIPTLTELHADIQEMGFFSCMCIMFILFICKYDNPEVMIMNTIMNADDLVAQNMMKKIYRNENYKNALILWLPFLNERGFLDTMIAD